MPAPYEPKPNGLNPEECIRKFVKFLELEYSHRVEAKLGRMTHTSRGMHPFKGHSHVGMRTVSKPRSPIISPYRKSLLGLQEAIGLRVSKETEGQLVAVFMRYCAMGDSTNYLHMHRGAFLKLARDCGLPTNDIGMPDISLMFEAVRFQSTLVGDRDLFLTFREFLEVLARVAMRTYPGSDATTAVSKLAAYKVLPNAARMPPKDIFADALADSRVLACVKENRRLLRGIFKFYINVEEQMGSAMTWDDVTGRLDTVSIKEFSQFAVDFEVIPDILNKVQLSRAFRDSAFKGTDASQLDYNEFEECIARCALFAYGYRPALAPPVVSEFQPVHPEVSYKVPPRRRARTPKRGERVKKVAEPPKMGAVADVYAKNLWSYVKDKETIEADQEALSLSGALEDSRLMDTLGSEESGLTAMSSPPCYIVRLARDNNLTRSLTAHREFELQKKYYPPAGLPVIYHEKMATMVGQRKYQEEFWSECRRARQLGMRMESRVRTERRAMEREELEARSLQRGWGFPGLNTYRPPQSAPVGVTRPLTADCTSILATGGKTIDDRLDVMTAAEAWPRRYL
mmetsp:Transcript_53996/g.171346  ORF Transcript_53996/g.171346 Transcript_53996/m.171346 type:complete len:570 (-) Transcript_53996:54-1763(-)